MRKLIFGLWLAFAAAGCEDDRIFRAPNRGGPKPQPSGGFRGRIFDLKRAHSRFKLDIRFDTLKVAVERGAVTTMEGDTTRLSKSVLKDGQEVTVRGTFVVEEKDSTLTAETILIHGGGDDKARRPGQAAEKQLPKI